MKTRITYVAVFGFVDSAENHVADLVCHFCAICFFRHKIWFQIRTAHQTAHLPADDLSAAYFNGITHVSRIISEKRSSASTGILILEV